jgi:hypothetical protein
MNIGRSTLVVGLLLAFSAVPAQATVIYTYTGQSFTSTFGTVDATDSVSATLSLDEALAADITSATDISSLAGFALTLSAGPSIIANTSANVHYMRSEVTTDALGRIAEWRFDLSWSPTPVEHSSIFTRHWPGYNADLVIDSRVIGGARGDYDGYGSVGPKGFWISTTVPEPSIIALFALGLVGIGFARRRQS